MLFREIFAAASDKHTHWFLVNDQRDAQILFYVFIYIYNSLYVTNDIKSHTYTTTHVTILSI